MAYAWFGYSFPNTRPTRCDECTKVAFPVFRLSKHFFSLRRDVTLSVSINCSAYVSENNLSCEYLTFLVKPPVMLFRSFILSVVVVAAIAERPAECKRVVTHDWKILLGDDGEKFALVSSPRFASEFDVKLKNLRISSNSCP